MNSIPIFDSLIHPTVNGFWMEKEAGQICGITTIEKMMESANIKWAFAVGMNGVGNYDEKKFLSIVQRSKANLLPVAFYGYPEISGKKKTKEWVTNLKKAGFKGVKVHPRISGLNLGNKDLSEMVKICGTENLPVLLCTYFYSPCENCSGNNIDSLIKFLINSGDTKMILLHAGTVRLLEMLEVARAFKNVLLDLSFTLNKYKGSSLDKDISFAFRNFDRRICIGSDYPEFTPADTRKRFEEFSKGLPKEKKENIAYKNIFKFLELTPDEIK